MRIYCATVSGMTPTPASALGRAGQFFEIREGDREVIVTEQGANLYRVRWAGTDLLDIVNDDGYTGGGGHGQLLLPWPGRVRNAVYEFEDEHYQLPINDLVHGSAIHGFTHWMAWEVKEHQENKLTLSCLLLAQPGYPFPLLFEQTYHLNGGVLEVSTMATNLGARTAPIGCGAHPYFKTGTGTVDGSVLQVQAASYFKTNDDLSPKLPAVPVTGPRSISVSRGPSAVSSTTSRSPTWPGTNLDWRRPIFALRTAAFPLPANTTSPSGSCRSSAATRFRRSAATAWPSSRAHARQMRSTTASGSSGSPPGARPGCAGLSRPNSAYPFEDQNSHHREDAGNYQRRPEVFQPIALEHGAEGS